MTEAPDHTRMTVCVPSGYRLGSLIVLLNWRTCQALWLVIYVPKLL